MRFIALSGNSAGRLPHDSEITIERRVTVHANGAQLSFILNDAQIDGQPATVDALEALFPGHVQLD